MDGSFHSSRQGWQERWQGLVVHLESTLDNRAYRFLLCSATVVLVVGYAAFASRIAEPPRFIESRFVRIDESPVDSKSQGFTTHDVDQINRAILRMHKLASVLDITPRRLSVRPTREMIRTRFAFEYHLLRLWIDEVRGFYSGGMYEMTSEAIARAIIAITFRDDGTLPAETSGWYEQVKTLAEICAERRESKATLFVSSWVSLCEHVRSHGGGEGASPLSLSSWLTRQLIAESSQHSTASRIGFLRGLMHASANPNLLEYERVNRWPTDAKKFGSLLQNIMSEIAPLQASKTDFRAFVPWLQIKLESQTNGEVRDINGLHVGLLIVTSCRAPRLVDFRGFDSREVVWVQVCPKSLSSVVSLIPAANAELFAEKNPDVSFVQLGVPEISYALKQGWIDAKTDITDFVIGSSGHTRSVAYQVRPQREEWNPKAQAFRIKAPLEVLKLMRLRAI